MSETIGSPVVLPSPVREWVEAFNAGNVETIVSLYEENAELSDSGMIRSRRGKQEIACWFALRFQSMPTNRYIPISKTVDDQGQILVTWNLLGRGPRLLGQGWLSRPFKIAGMSKFRLHDGRIYQQEGIYDHLAVLKQIMPLLCWSPVRLTRFIYMLYLRFHHQI